MSNLKDKKMLIAFVRIFAFVLAFAVIIYGLSQVLYSNKTATRYGNSFRQAYSYTDDPENTLQIAGIGNSDLMSGFVPTALWQEYGYTSTLLSAGKMQTSRAYEMMGELLEVQSPNLIMIEVDMLYESSTASKRASDNTLRGKLDYFFLKAVPERFDEKFENKLTIFRFHDSWKSIGAENTDENETPSSHGYRYCAEIQPVRIENYMRPSDDIEEIPVDSLEYLNKMIETCNENGIQVMLLEMPSGTSWDYQRHNAVQQYADDRGLIFVDMNTCTDEYGLDFKSDFRDYDANHLNYFGAQKATSYIGGIIAENYELENRLDNPDYAYWNDYCDSFKQEMTQVKSTGEELE